MECAVKHRFAQQHRVQGLQQGDVRADDAFPCLLYTSVAADERSSVDLGGRRIIKDNRRGGSAAL